MIYTFYFPHSNIVQQKILITHEEYLKCKIYPDDSKKVEKAKEKLLKHITSGHQWFTDQSPLFKAISIGIHDCNGYQHKVFIKQGIYK